MIALPYSRIFDYRLVTKDAHRKTLALAFEACSFTDWKRLRTGLDALNNGGRILVKPGGMNPGRYFPETCLVKVQFLGRPWSSPKKNAASFLHEIGGHALDLLSFTAERRSAIYSALHDGAPPASVGQIVYPSWGWKVLDPMGPKSDHGHDWYDDAYHEGVAEAYSEAFVAAFAPELPVGEWPAHPFTPGALEAIRQAVG